MPSRVAVRYLRWCVPHKHSSRPPLGVLVQHWSRKADDSRAQMRRRTLVFFPGNPGCCGFYDLLVSDLMSSDTTLQAVFVVSHTGFDGRGFTPRGYTASLEEQVQHKKHLLVSNLLPGFRGEGPFRDIQGSQLVLGGHSFGCFVGLRLLADPSFNGPLPFRTAVYWWLFPTIHRIGDSPNGQRLTPLLKSRFARRILPCLASGFVPRWIVRCVTHFTHPELSSPIADELWSPESLRSTLALGEQEMNLITDLDAETLCQHGNRVHVISSCSDSWCPQSYLEEIAACSHDIRISVHADNGGHAAPTKRAHTLRFARLFASADFEPRSRL